MPAVEPDILDQSASGVEVNAREIPYVDMAGQWAEERDALLPIIEKVLAEGHWVGGSAIPRFEAAAARLCGVAHAVALNSGTDALVCAMAALGMTVANVVAAARSVVTAAED